MKSLTRTRYGVRRKLHSISPRKYGLYKFLPILLFAALFLFHPKSAFAANNCTWTNGGGDNLWNNASNWTSCGSTTPGSADTAIFDSANSNANVTINAAVNVAGWTMQNGYSGTISQGTNTITIGTSGWTQSTGTFTGGSSSITNSGNFSLTGGTFTDTSGTDTEDGSTWTNSGGSYTAGGTVSFLTSSTITGSTTFNNLTFSSNLILTWTIASGTTLTTTGTLTLDASGVGHNGTLSGSGVINAQGNITITNHGTIGTGLIVVNGTSSQTITGGNLASDNFSLPSLTINKISGTLSFVNSISVAGNWTYTQGSLSMGTSTIEFSNNGVTTTIAGSMTFNNLEFYSNVLNTYTISSGTTITATGILTYASDGSGVHPCTVNGPGILNAQGNVTTASNGCNGSVALQLSGTSAQTLTLATSDNHPTGNITINKASGTVTLGGAINISNASQDILISQGYLNMSTYNLTVADIVAVNNGTLTQGSGTLSVGTLIINANGTVTNNSTGAITIGAGGVINYGTFNAGSLATACGASDTVAITSSSTGTARNWSGNGNYNFYDIKVQDQNESPYKGKVVAWSSTNNGNTNFTVNSGCPPGPIMNLKLDEGTGTTANDSSKNGFTGTLSGSTLPSWQSSSSCVSGSCLLFDGSSSKITFSSAPSGVETVSMWVKPNSVSSGALIDLDGGTHKITVSSGTISATGFTSPTIYVNGVATSTLIANQWQYVEVTTATSFSATSSMTIGNSSTTYFNGYLDEIRIYNYVRSSSQIQDDYNKVAGTVLGANTAALSNGLVGYYKLDENTGTTSSDSSGNGRTMSFTNAPSWVNGKYGSALSFNGTNQFATTPAGSGLNYALPVYTVSFWMNATNAVSSSKVETVLMKRYQNTHGANFEFTWSHSTTSFQKACSHSTSGGTFSTGAQITDTMNAGTWYFVTCTYDGTTLRAYLNGKLEGSTTIGTPDQDTFNGLYLGNAIDINYFNGSLDDVRVYNRALSGNEVQQLYNFAPGPVGYWSFENGSGSSVSDVSGNSNTGTWNGTLGAQWTSGKYGKAGNFNGTDNYVSIPDSTSLRNTRFTLNFWIYANAAASTSNWTYPISSNNSAQTGENYGFAWNNGSGSSFTQSCEEKAIDSTYYDAHISTTMQPKTWYFVTCTYDGTSLNAYLNGVLQSSVVAGTPNTGTTLGIGAHGDGTNPFSGKIDQVQIYNYARTPSQIIQDMNGGHPLGGSPVGSELGWWKFDEGYGTTANNVGSAGTALNGTLSGTAPTWTNFGKFGRALSFGGAGYVSVADSTAVDPTSDTTLSAWVNLSTNNALHEIAAKDSNTGGLAYRLYTTSTGKVAMDVKNGSTTNTATGLTILSTGKWYHVVGVYSAGNSVTVYVNGIQDGQTTSSIISTIGTNSQAFTIGADLSGGSNAAANFMSGSIDEVKLFSGAMTAQDVLNDYNRGSSQVLGATGNNSGSEFQARSQTFCVPGDSSTCSNPVGDWNFEEGSGTSVNDTSGNGNTGTWNGSGNHWTSGKVGKAGNFNGSNDYVSVANTINSVETISFWVNPTSTTTNLLALTGSAYLTSSGGTITPTGFTSPSIYVNGVLNGTLSANKWNFVEVTTGTGINGTAITFGKANSAFLTGKLDQIRMFTYPRTQAQVTWDYNRGLPIGWWKMDECQGSTLNDNSGNGNNGTITIGASGTQTAVGNCNTSSTAWGNGATGKFGHSLNLDGTDDFVSMGNPTTFQITGALTLSAWVKLGTTGVNQVIMGRQNAGQDNYNLLVDTTNNGCLDINGTWYCGTSTLTTGKWYHIVGVYVPSTSVSVYINGKLESTSTTSIPSSINNAAQNFVIGKSSGGFWFLKGQVDDARVYNYPLTSSQVQQVYNFGQGIEFGNP